MKIFLVHNVLYIVVVLPVLLSAITYTLGVRLTKNKWKSIHKTVQWTAIFYLFADIILIKMIFNVQVIGYTLIIIIFMLAIIIVNQWKKENEVSLIKGFKLMWRIIFLFFAILYIGLLVYKLIYYLLQ